MSYLKVLRESSRRGLKSLNAEPDTSETDRVAFILVMLILEKYQGLVARKRTHRELNRVHALAADELKQLRPCRSANGDNNFMELAQRFIRHFQHALDAGADGEYIKDVKELLTLENPRTQKRYGSREAFREYKLFRSQCVLVSTAVLTFSSFGELLLDPGLLMHEYYFTRMSLEAHMLSKDFLHVALSIIVLRSFGRCEDDDPLVQRAVEYLLNHQDENKGTWAGFNDNAESSFVVTLASSLALLEQPHFAPGPAVVGAAFALDEQRKAKVQAEEGRAERVRAEEARRDKARRDKARAKKAREEKAKADMARADLARAHESRASDARAKNSGGNSGRTEQGKPSKVETTFNTIVGRLVNLMNIIEATAVMKSKIQDHIKKNYEEISKLELSTLMLERHMNQTKKDGDMSIADCLKKITAKDFSMPSHVVKTAKALKKKMRSLVANSDGGKKKKALKRKKISTTAEMEEQDKKAKKEKPATIVAEGEKKKGLKRPASSASLSSGAKRAKVAKTKAAASATSSKETKRNRRRVPKHGMWYGKYRWEGKLYEGFIDFAQPGQGVHEGQYEFNYIGYVDQASWIWPDELEGELTQAAEDGNEFYDGNVSSDAELTLSDIARKQ